MSPVTEDAFTVRHDGFTYSGRVRWSPGAPPPVCFVSGAFQSMASWRKFADHFGRDRTVVLCDLPGTGDGDVLPSGYGLDFLAIALARAIDHLGIPRLDVVSASYGSPIAYRFAQLFPERVARLVLAGVMREIPPALRARTAATLASLADGRLDDFARQVVEGLLCADPSRFVARRDLARRVLLSQLQRMSPLDQLKYVHNTTRLLEHDALDLDAAPPVPALVFTGEHDVYTTPASCREVAAAFDDATFTTIADADHLFHVERFEATLALLDGFLRDRLDRPAGCPGSRDTGSSGHHPVPAFGAQPTGRMFWFTRNRLSGS